MASVTRLYALALTATLQKIVKCTVQTQQDNRKTILSMSAQQSY